MKKLYKYTVLRQDGTVQVLPPCEKKEFRGAGGLYDLLDCGTIEIIPKVYYKPTGRFTLYGDEEGRFNDENHTNPHFEVIIDMFGQRCDVVGDIVKEEVYHAQ